MQAQASTMHTYLDGVRLFLFSYSEKLVSLRELLLIFSFTQVADGIFTYIGTAMYGVEAEANPLIAYFMMEWGFGFSLLMVKAVAVVCGILIWVLGEYKVLAILTTIYLYIAVLPWTVALRIVLV